MKKHTKVYMSYFNYDVGDFIPCEVCGTTAVDIHHINCRGMGGSQIKDVISNLMALCRKCHLEYGDKKQHIELLRQIHANKISSD
jgi:hypothetical protein